jgi:PAS domain S-box-containing protein
VDFLGEKTVQVLTTWAKECHLCLMVATADGGEGSLPWVNRAFENWTGYTRYELNKIGWKQLSVNDEDLQADIKAVEECVQGKRTSYTIRKRYIPKNESPQWGELSVVRYPEHGPVEYFLCVWIPLANQTSQAFSMAIANIEASTRAREMTNEELKALRREIEHANELTAAQKLMLGIVDMAWAHPKAAWAVIFLLASLIVSANILDIIKSLSGIQSQISTPKAPTQQPATQIASLPPIYTLQTRAGNTLTIGEHNAVRTGVTGLRCSTEQAGCSVEPVRRFSLADLSGYWRGVGSTASIGGLHGEHQPTAGTGRF